MNNFYFYLFTAAKKGFKLGAIVSLGIFAFIRLLFWGYDFSITEELTNVIKIVSFGGLMFSAALISFLMVERGLVLLAEFKLPIPALRIKRIFASALGIL